MAKFKKELFGRKGAELKKKTPSSTLSSKAADVEKQRGDNDVLPAGKEADAGATVVSGDAVLFHSFDPRAQNELDVDRKKNYFREESPGP